MIDETRLAAAVKRLQEVQVRGLIVAHTPDTALAYAVSMAPTVDLHLYEVRFILRPAPEPEAR